MMPISAALPVRTYRRMSSEYKTDTLIDDIFALADALGSSASRWSATTGAERSPGARPCDATRGSLASASSTRHTRSSFRRA